MAQNNREFDLYPKVVKAGEEYEFILPAPEGGFDAGLRYEIESFARETVAEVGEGEDKILLSFGAEGGLHFRHSFAGEQEHALSLYVMKPEGREFLAELKVYSLLPDLHALRPYKGDFHLHSNRSDGKEPPAEVAAASRAIGLDFMAVTDHSQYAPSLEAIAAFAGQPIDLRIYPGEEIHPPDNSKIHMINFGGKFSINELFADRETFLREAQEIGQQLPAELSPRERYLYASTLWCYEKIRVAGGLAVFCHPYWITHDRYCVPETILARHFADRPFDALELIGGYYPSEVESNLLQVARYQEERAQGRRIPIVGASDSHGCECGELFGWYYSIVFAASPDLPDIKRAIADLHSLAVEALPGAPPKIYGPFRLVKYAAFLGREVFPAHDALCRAEGEWMFAHLAGDQTAAAQLPQLQGQTEKLRRRLWGEE
jgi:hypothetical protein